MFWQSISKEARATLGLTLGCILLGAILGAAIDGAAYAPGTMSEYIQKWQTLLGALLALIGIVVAYWNVSRQIEAQQTKAALDLMSREETRIETCLPGLRDARVLAGMIYFGYRKHRNDVNAYLKYLERWGFKAFEEKESADEISKVLPTADADTKQEFRALVRRLLASCTLVQRAINKNDLEQIEKRLKEMQTRSEAFKGYHDDAKSKIKRYEERSKALRTKIESYFDQ
jgi:hypothetical protein